MDHFVLKALLNLLPNVKNGRNVNTATPTLATFYIDRGDIAYNVLSTNTFTREKISRVSDSSKQTFSGLSRKQFSQGPPTHLDHRQHCHTTTCTANSTATMGDTTTIRHSSYYNTY